MSGWRVERVSGAAADLHARDALSLGERTASMLEVTRPALVLGSSQKLDVVDLAAVAALDVDVTRRRTGGGAVLLMPGDATWIDVVIRPSDPLWQDDIRLAFEWLGQVWVEALGDLGVEGSVVNQNAVCRSVLGRLVCFAGLGFGEVSSGDGKTVGMSQRRTRAGAWFQCVVMRRWDPARYASLLAPGLAAVADDPRSELADVRVQLVDVEPHRMFDVFAGHLPPST